MGLVRYANADEPSDGILIPKAQPCEPLVDHDHTFAGAGVAFRECAAIEQLHAQSLEEAIRHIRKIRVARAAGVGRRVVGARKGRALPVVGHRYGVAETDGLYSPCVLRRLVSSRSTKAIRATASP